MLAGVIPGDADAPSLNRRVMAGRYSEIRMLYFVGKDVMRWIGQCMECVERIPELTGHGIQPQSLAAFLTGAPPEQVQAKLKRWGVADHQSIFARAIGIHSLFAAPPVLETLSEEFLLNYHRYCDHLYRCFMELQPHAEIGTARFHFDLYASGEYTRMLEIEWSGEPR